MISILYNEKDYEAASIALKVQSLAQNSTSKIYIVPKHYGRNPDNVSANLSKTQSAIFIAHDTSSIDEQTKQELTNLIDKSIPLQIVIPNWFKLRNSVLEHYQNKSVYEYSNTDKSQIVNDLAQYIKKIPQKIKGSSKQKNDDIAAGILIAGLALLLLALATSDAD
jgi:hypothetical protein